MFYLHLYVFFLIFLHHLVHRNQLRCNNRHICKVVYMVNYSCSRDNELCCTHHLTRHPHLTSSITASGAGGWRHFFGDIVPSEFVSHPLSVSDGSCGRGSLYPLQIVEIAFALWMCGFSAPRVGGNFSDSRFLVLNSSHLSSASVWHLLFLAYTAHTKASSMVVASSSSKSFSPKFWKIWMASESVSRVR